jgi:hypothetical protein
MRLSDIPFARLRSLLLGLGFQERTIEGKPLGTSGGMHLAFYHAESDTIFTFRLYRLQDKVSKTDIIGVRSQLDWRGLLSREAFDAALRKVSA